MGGRARERLGWNPEWLVPHRTMGFRARRLAYPSSLAEDLACEHSMRKIDGLGSPSYDL